MFVALACFPAFRPALCFALLLLTICGLWSVASSIKKPITGTPSTPATTADNQVSCSLCLTSACTLLLLSGGLWCYMSCLLLLFEFYLCSLSIGTSGSRCSAHVQTSCEAGTQSASSSRSSHARGLKQYASNAGIPSGYVSSWSFSWSRCPVCSFHPFIVLW